MNLKDAYRKKVEAMIEEEKAHLDLLRARTKNALADGAIAASDEIKASEKRLQMLKEKLQEMADASGSIWKEIKAGLELAWKDLANASRKAATKFAEAASNPPPTARRAKNAAAKRARTDKALLKSIPSTRGPRRKRRAPGYAATHRRP